ncbi:low-density lipoprotein receptor-related protein 8-like [Ornithodoros turicata]|uniref:low-density lipoprotein receptor-related protein 8-like n=1 Tax=Ornithodoros turicata TaxID=34597 RepID=UPI0031395B99
MKWSVATLCLFSMLLHVVHNQFLGSHNSLESGGQESFYPFRVPGFSLAGTGLKQTRRPTLGYISPRAQFAEQPKPEERCRPRQLSFCDDVLPYNETSSSGLAGVDSNRPLGFFMLLLKTHCNVRLKQLVCALLEPPCRRGKPMYPCRKFCKVATENCQNLIPSTLSLSRVLDCRRYPDSDSSDVCLNLARSPVCLSNEHQCPDYTCIPEHWRCDGVRDCPLAADEANCTGKLVCNKDEFRCDMRCIPNTWRCDGEADCKDAADEANCPPKPQCGPDRFACSDGVGCLPRRWVCDGRAECRDASDEKDCANKRCTPGDFQCDNGICVPSLWRCDGQNDCKDGSDEKHCGTFHQVLGMPNSLSRS